MDYFQHTYIYVDICMMEMVCSVYIRINLVSRIIVLGCNKEK